ncbi:hypothetical protein ERJ75_001445500 [Trypanosoma vivax]|uniref:EF-hand domain-containing protein n=1 Tax=Trypanosoma vivax (strain Y486) TaxID=1055687 RepID=G0U848_TRYVY|nr:hypothetical protein TRVL_02783 [Trypanosoma vivax]KAH8607319.1 hypothetical protein ERJ75_001445500 [Trypanosoma vivax]CCC52057.1 conserved hypothetical protein [Trypanosoma vivax Y486]
MPPRKKVPKYDANGENVAIGSKRVLSSVLDKPRRERHSREFDEIVKANVAISVGIEKLPTVSMKEIPTLAVGFIARAMGLNLSNEEVLTLVEMVEEKDSASRGFVPAASLKAAIIEGLLTGVVALPVEEAPLPKKKGSTPSPKEKVGINVSRDDEETIYKAFCTIDVAKRGYLEADELRLLMCNGEEPFTNEEMENMIAAAADPETGYIFYEDFADVLANE